VLIINERRTRVFGKESNLLSLKARLSTILAWRISPNPPRKPGGAIRFSVEKARSRVAYSAAKFATIFSARLTQRRNLLTISTTIELYRADTKCAVFSVRMDFLRGTGRHNSCASQKFIHAEILEFCAAAG
jgi:hypothetical protein